MSRLITLHSEEELVDHLHNMNDSGTDPTVAGITMRTGSSQIEPFIAMLRGPYAGEHVVLFNTPWDGEVSFPRTRCDECTAGEPSTFSDLDFPIQVIVE